MLDVLWTPLVVFSIWSYIGLNVFRYKHFDYNDEGKSLILFILFRVIVISVLITYLFLSFNDYVFYCQLKLYFYFVSIIGIIGVEMMYSYFLNEYFNPEIQIMKRIQSIKIKLMKFFFFFSIGKMEYITILSTT